MQLSAKLRKTVLGSVAVLLACGSRQTTPAAPRSVSITEFADSAGLMQDLGTAGKFDDGDWVAWLSGSDTTDASFVQVLHSTLSAPAEATVRDAVLTNLIDTARDKPGRYTLRASVRGGAVVLRASRSTGKPPVLVNTAFITERLLEVAREYPQTAMGEVRMLVGVDGEPTRVEFGRITGNAALDREFLRVARLARFSVGHVDGYPAAIWVEVPLSINVR